MGERITDPATSPDPHPAIIVKTTLYADDVCFYVERADPALLQEKGQYILDKAAT